MNANNTPLRTYADALRGLIRANLLEEVATLAEETARRLEEEDGPDGDRWTMGGGAVALESFAKVLREKAAVARKEAEL